MHLAAQDIHFPLWPHCVLHKTGVTSLLSFVWQKTLEKSPADKVWKIKRKSFRHPNLFMLRTALVLIPASLVVENRLLNNYFFFSVGFLWLWHFCSKLRRLDDVRGATKPVLCTAQEKKCTCQISSQVKSQMNQGVVEFQKSFWSGVMEDSQIKWYISWF